MLASQLQISFFKPFQSSFSPLYATEKALRRVTNELLIADSAALFFVALDHSADFVAVNQKIRPSPLFQWNSCHHHHTSHISLANLMFFLKTKHESSINPFK